MLDLQGVLSMDYRYEFVPVAKLCSLNKHYRRLKEGDGGKGLK